MDKSALGQLIRRRRRALDLTQEQLAARVGCAVSTLRKIEAGALRPSRQLAARLARFLELPAAEQSAFVRLARRPPDNADTTRASAAPNAEETLPEPAQIAAADLTGQTLRGYRLLALLGRGGGGEVYRAQHPAIAREVAIKLILPQLAAQPQFIRRFAAEAQTVARLEHPQIVPLYDYWRDPDGACLVMRYLRGGNLAERLRTGRLTEPELLTLLSQLAGALDFAHRHGVVHRDLKPANVLLDETGAAYLADFGVAFGPDEAGDDHGAIVGSPHYMAPEQIRAEPVTPQTDGYALGLLAYELFSGQRAFADLPTAELLRCHLHEPLPPLTDPPRPALDALLARATAKDPAARFASATALVAALHHTLSAAPLPNQPPDDDLPNPYCGLAAFAEEDGARFFGREALVQRLVERLAEDDPQARFLAVVGPSGSGKSSLVRAGLLPALRAGALPYSERWLTTSCLPGAQPTTALAEALLQVAPAADPGLAERLRADPDALAAAVQTLLPADGTTELVLLIDQFEELFTLAPPHERAATLAALAAVLAAPNPRLWLVVTLRADFYDRPLLEPSLGALFRDRTEPVTPLTAAELRAAISQPAAQVGVSLEPTLVDALLADTIARPGALPQLQFALTELFERRAGPTLTLADYRALGGLGGALARRADELYAALGPEQQPAVRQLFLQLITPGEGSEATRRRAPLLPADTAIAEPYARARLLTLDRDPASRAPTVEIAHEALIRDWDRLRSWVDGVSDTLRLVRRLRLSAAEWLAAGRDPSFLAAGARLEQFAALDPALLAADPTERGFLLASSAAYRAALEQAAAQSAAEERERRERERLEAQHAADERGRRRLRSSLLVIGAALIIASGLAVFSYQQQRTAASAQQAAERSAEETALLARAGDVLVPSERPLEQTLLLARAGAALGEPYPPLVRAAIVRAYAEVPLRQILPGQQTAVVGLALSPDGGRAASLATDGRLVVLVRASGQQQVVQAHGQSALALGWSADGQLLLTCARDGVRLWRASDLTLLLDLPLPDLIGAALSPGGTRLLLLHADGALTLHTASSGALEQRLGVHPGLRAAAWSADGALVASGGTDTRVRVWDAISGGQRAELTGHGNAVLAVGWNADGTRIVSGGADRATLVWRWGPKPALERGLSAVGDAADLVAFSPDGGQIAVGSADGALYLFDPDNPAPQRRLPGHSGAVTALAWGPGGLLVSGDAAGTVRLWRGGPGGRAALPRHSGAVSGISFSPDGGRVATSGIDGFIRLVDLRGSGRVITLRSPAGRVSAVAFSPDGQRIATADEDGALRLWDTADGRARAALTGHQGAVSAVAWSADGTRLLSGGADATVRLWDAASGAQLQIFSGHSGGVVAVAFSPDGQRALSGSRDATARVWDLQRGAAIFTLGQGAGPVWSALWTPDGQRLVTNGGPLTVWRAADGAALPLPNPALAAARGGALSPNGQLLLVSRLDSALDLWDFHGGEALLRLAGTGSLVTAAAWRADGRAVITGDARGEARVWLTDPRSMVAELDRRLCGTVSEDQLSAAIPGWRGCAAELAADAPLLSATEK